MWKLVLFSCPQAFQLYTDAALPLIVLFSFEKLLQIALFPTLFPKTSFYHAVSRLTF